MKAFLTKLLRDQQGTSAIEMGLICSLIVLAMLTALENFAGESQITWNTISSKVQNATSGS
ncbi:MAG: Flp family type IVb pilin [Sphingomonadaceae bacterium]|nr:Flp family type IVb pilin [Sphingomonadaceae bacterium]